MNENKLSLDKFRVTRLTGINKIVGGATGHDDESHFTDKDAPTEPVCIKTSEEVIYPDPFDDTIPPSRGG